MMRADLKKTRTILIHRFVYALGSPSRAEGILALKALSSELSSFLSDLQQLAKISDSYLPLKIKAISKSTECMKHRR